MKRPKKILICKRKSAYLTVGRAYQIISIEKDGYFIYNDNGHIVFVTKEYFE